MADSRFELYVSKDGFERELAELDGKLSKLNGPLTEYQQKKAEASRVWGEQDENLAKAQQMCDTAIRVVEKKIDETRQSKEALQSVLSSAEDFQSKMGQEIETQTEIIEKLLN